MSNKANKSNRNAAATVNAANETEVQNVLNAETQNVNATAETPAETPEVPQTVEDKMRDVLTSKIKGFAIVETATQTETRSGKPSAAMRENGALVFSRTAGVLIGFPQTKFFKLGVDAEENVYLIPALEADKQVVKGNKNVDSFMLTQTKVLNSINVVTKDKFTVTKEEEDGVIYFKLLKLKDKAEAAAEAPKEGEATAAETPAE